MKITSKLIDCVFYKNKCDESIFEGERVLVVYAENGGETYVTIGNPEEESLFFEAEELLRLLLSFEQVGKIWEDMFD